MQQTAAPVQAVSQDSLYNAADPFLLMFTKLESMGYYRQQQPCDFPLDSGYCCQIPPTENFINKGIATANKKILRKRKTQQPAHQTTAAIQPLNLQGLLEIKSCLLKADIKAKRKSHPRATVEEWTFASEASASAVTDQLSSLSPKVWSQISQTPPSWWRQGLTIYFIIPAGKTTATELARLKQKIEENI